MKTSKTTKALLLGATLAVTGTALAYGGGPCSGHGDCGYGSRGDGAFGLPGLTSEQRDRLDELRDQRRDAMQDLRDAMRDNRDALRQALDDDASSDTVEQLAEKQGELVTRKILERIETRKQLSEILTDEQRQVLADRRTERQARHRPGYRW